MSDETVKPTWVEVCPQCGRDDVNHFYRMIDGVDHSVCNVCGWDSAE